jgi:hypothetical protein
MKKETYIHIVIAAIEVAIISLFASAISINPYNSCNNLFGGHNHDIKQKNSRIIKKIWDYF